MVYCVVFTDGRPLLARNHPSHFPSILNFSELSPFFAASSETSQKSRESNLVSAFFSIKPFPSFALFFTLDEISPVVATLTQNTLVLGVGIFSVANFPSPPRFPFGCGLYLEPARELELSATTPSRATPLAYCP